MMMASIPNAPMMAQSGMTVPGNLTQTQVQEIYQKYLKMKENGVREDDPEYINTHQLLAAISRDASIRKAQKNHQETIARQRQQQAQQQAVNGHVAVNGGGLANEVVNGQTTPTAKVGATPTTPVDGQSQNLNGKPANAASKPNNNFTAEQVQTLRSQILAFKILSKNLPIPPSVQQQLFASQQSRKQEPKSPAIAPAVQSSDGTPQASTALTNATALSERGSQVEKVVSQLSLLKNNGRLSYSEHAIRKARAFIPALLPAGVDVHAVREDREKKVYNRIMARRAELESVPANLASWDTRKHDTLVADETIRTKALIELRMLRLLPKQRELRQQISRDMIYYDNLSQTANRAVYRRQKKTTLREARITENLEKKQRDARESNEKRKQYEHLQAILHHVKELRENAVTQKTRAQKLGRMMLSHHQHIEKEEQKRVERTAKQRLQALKNDDEATYLKLLGQAKDSRISHLLKQTDGFLKQLAASVKQQQRSAVDIYGGAEEEVPEEDASDNSDDEDGPKVDYYQVAHRIKEEVTKQADMLVGGTLKEYQVKGLQWMISLYNNNLNGILADEMGLGKTIQTISLITYLIEKKKHNGPYLVIVPLSTLTNWNLEFEKWAPSVARVVYKGAPAARRLQQNQIRYGNFQVLLTTYEYVIRDRPVLSKIKWLHMIVDEGHRMKNSQSKLSSTLTQYYHTRYRLILTGTPLQNNLPELWALLNFALPTIFKSVKSFDEWFNTPFANTGVQDKMELTEEEQLLVIKRLHKVLRPFLLRRLKKDVEKDLPDKQERIIKCKFSALQAKLYKQLVTYSQMSVSDGKGGKTGMRGLTNMLMQLRKLCNHPFVFEQVEEQMNPGKSTNDLIWRTAGKFELLDRILPKFLATGHRVLMFFQMTQIMNIMEDFLRLRGMQYLRLDGSTKSDDRSELLRLFNAPNSPYFCFLLSTRAGGLGLNLQTADTVIIYDSDWNPHQDLQAQDRAHRIGQKNEVRILRLISSNSVEEKILERARYKLDMDGKVIQAGKFDNKSTNEERENLLRTLLDAAESGEQFTEQEEMDDDDLNANMARSENEIVVFQKMDAERALDPKYGPDRKLGRLMGESELPELYLSEENPVTEVVEEYAGRGARERTRVKYDDGLTEEQWLNAVDDDEDTIEAAIARKNARIEKRTTNKEKRARGGEDSESPEPSRHSSEEPAPKKRARKVNPPKRKAEEEMEEAPAAKKKRGRGTKALDTLTPSERSKLQKILNNVYQHLMDLEEEVPGEPSDDEDGPLTRGIIDPFIKLVPRNHYPDYYLVITNPIAMENIQKKINRNEYQSLREFVADIRLLCTNARIYNEDSSQLYIDANDIEAAALSKLRSETAKHPELQGFDDDEASNSGSVSMAGGLGADGTSTANASGTATPNMALPVPSGSGVGTKLKLTFNGGANGSAIGLNAGREGNGGSGGPGSNEVTDLGTRLGNGTGPSETDGIGGGSGESD